MRLFYGNIMAMEDHGIYDQSDDMILYIMSHSINYCMIPPSKLTVCCGSHGPYISMVYSTSSKWWFSTIFHQKKKTSDLPSFTGRLRVAVHLMWDLLTKGAATRWRTTVPSKTADRRIGFDKAGLESSSRHCPTSQAGTATKKDHLCCPWVIKCPHWTSPNH